MDVIQVDTSSWKLSDCFKRSDLLYRPYTMTELLHKLTGLTFEKYIKKKYNVLDFDFLQQIVMDYEMGMKHMLKSPADDILLMLLLLHNGKYWPHVNFDKNYDDILCPTWMEKYLLSHYSSCPQLIDYYLSFLSFP